MARLFGNIQEKNNASAGQQKAYASYEEALQACNTGYENSDLCRVIARKTTAYREELKQLPYNINSVHCYLTLVIQNILLEKKVTALSIADFGGACGAHYFETRRLLPPNIQLDWTVVETPAMVSSATGCGMPNEELSFTSGIDNITADLFYLSSSIQYVSQPHHILQALIDKQFPYILFNRMMLDTVADTDTITVQQSMLSANGPGPLPPGETDIPVLYPHTTLSLNKFLRLLKPSYDLLLRFDEPSGKISSAEHITGGGFLFRKK